MRRYFETFFRGQWLYLSVLLLMLAASVMGTLSQSKAEYESTALIWLDKPALNNVLNQNESFFAPPPAQQQADKLFQLLQTDAFVTNLAKNTALASELSGVRDHDRPTLTLIRQSLAVAVLGPNTLKVAFESPDPVLCQQMVQNTIDQFRSWTLESQLEQSAVEVQFYQKQLQIYEDQINDIVQRIDALQKQYPAIYSSVTSPEYLEFQRLQRELESGRGLYNATKLKIDQTNLVESLSATSKQVQFQVIDKPAVPLLPSLKLKRLLKYVILGGAASVGLFVTAVVLATWLDPTIRTVDDVRRFGDIAVLEAIPNLPVNKRWWSMGTRAPTVRYALFGGSSAGRMAANHKVVVAYSRRSQWTTGLPTPIGRSVDGVGDSPTVPRRDSPPPRR